MADWLMKTIRAEARRLLELAADDEQLRADLRALAAEILAETEAPAPGACSPRMEPDLGLQQTHAAPDHSIHERPALEPQAPCSTSTRGSGRTIARTDSGTGSAVISWHFDDARCRDQTGIGRGRPVYP